MSRKLVGIVALAIIAVGGWTLWNKDHLHSVDDAWRLAGDQFAAWATAAVRSGATEEREFVRIASFCLDASELGPTHVPRHDAYLPEILAQFDIVAFQGVTAETARTLETLLQRLNRDGARYALVLPNAPERESGPALGFVFDQERITLDGGQIHPVADPDRLLKQQPWVACFRCAGVDPLHAFTFSLVNVQIDEDRAQAEIESLGELFRAIRSDGRGEDDVILAGNLNAPEPLLATVRQRAGLVWLIQGIPTNVQLDRQSDNVLLDPLATTEYTGRSGALDFVKRFNLSLAEAERISHHLPVWAEFAVVEGMIGLRAEPRTEVVVGDDAIRTR